MKINGIALKNFGIFLGKNEIDFGVKSKGQKNIVLIGGENGAGKSTLIEAIKLAIYGPLKYGLKTKTERYKNEIKNKLNYSLSPANNQEMSISIDFDLNRKGNMENYFLERKWHFNNGDVNEHLKIENEDNLLTTREIQEFNNYIRTVFPLKLFDFFMFDGEKMNNLLYQDEFAAILKNAVNTIFNLKITNTLKNDLDTYLTKTYDSNSLSKVQEEYIEIKKRYRTKVEELEARKNKINQITEKIEQWKNRREELREEFEKSGGLYVEQRKEIKEEIEDLEAEKEELAGNLNDFYDGLFPFIVNKGLLEEIKNQLRREKEYKKYINFKEEINDILSEDFIASIDFEDEIAEDKQEKFLNKAIGKMEERFKPEFMDEDDFNIVHNVSGDTEKMLINIIQNAQSVNLDKIKQDFERIEEINESKNELKNKLDYNKENTEFEDILEEIEQISIEIGKAEERLEELKEEIEIMRSDIEELRSKKESVFRELKAEKKKDNIPLLCSKIEKVLDEFNRTQKKKKIQEVETRFIDKINELLSHENYINDIDIDPDAFEVSLYGPDDEELDDLSSGEQQLAVMALLWALTEASKRQFPLMFDTLLGRIDSKHRNNIIELLKASDHEQIIMLATDTEINNDLYKELSDNICKSYLIDKKNKMEHNSEIRKKYFFNNEEEGNEIQVNDLKRDRGYFEASS